MQKTPIKGKRHWRTAHVYRSVGGAASFGRWGRPAQSSVADSYASNSAEVWPQSRHRQQMAGALRCVLVRTRPAARMLELVQRNSG
jgi:hypothetical protein